MKALRVCLALSLVVLFIAAAPPALGLANRVFVSARSGNNANSCDNILTPCQTFAGAVLQLNSGGEAIVLDSGGYGPVTITQSLTIEAPPGVLAFIHPPSGDAILISAGSSDVVTLRGLVLNGGAGHGISVDTVGVLHVESCVISGFSGGGLESSATGNLFISDTVVRENDFGLIFAAGRAAIDHCRVEHNQGDGIYVDGADVTVRDSVSAGNSENGSLAESGGAENSILNLDHCLSTNNGADGFATFKGGAGVIFARASNSSISENIGHGINNGSGATFESLGNNFVRGNYGGGDISGTITVVGGQ
jgi:hypothetical protein